MAFFWLGIGYNSRHPSNPFIPMKTLIRSVLCLLLLTAGKATAQETFAPLISENCIAFVHADFRKIELDTVKAFVQKTGEDFLTMLGFDRRSHQATARELAIELEKIDMLARPTFDLITKELGIRELAWIADMELLEKGIYFMAVAPWKGKTDEDLQKLFSVMPMEYREAYLPVGDFLFVAYPNFSVLTQNDPQEEKRIIAEWSQNLSRATPDSPIVEALQSVADMEIKAVAALPAPARQLLQNAPLPPDVPAEIRNVLLFAAQKINWASAGVSLYEILGTEPPANTGILMTVKTARPSDARMLHGMLESLIEFGINLGRFTMEEHQRNQNPSSVEIPPLAWQFVKGVLRTLLPDVEEDKLIFRIRAQFPGVDAVNFAAPALGIMTALVVPAVQASSEAFHRTHCTSKIKEIVLAFHSYHDVYNAFPPLYTVDADGRALHSWRVLILPFLGENALYEQIRLDEPWDSEHNSQFLSMMPSVYRCPSNPGGGSSYVVIAGEAFVPATGPDVRTGKTFANITDGASNTLAIIEVRDGFYWMAPRGNMTLEDLEQWPGMPDSRVGSGHHGGMNVGMFDGVVRFISRDTDSAILRALGTIAGGEQLSLPR